MEMTKEIAVQNVEKVFSAFVGDRKSHVILDEALNLIRRELFPPDEEDKGEDTCQEESNQSK